MHLAIYFRFPQLRHYYMGWGNFYILLQRYKIPIYLENN